jgi:hypothetical protein
MGAPAIDVNHTSHRLVSLLSSFAVALTVLHFGIAQKIARARDERSSTAE